MRIGFNASRAKRHQDFLSSYDYNLIQAISCQFPQNEYLFFNNGNLADTASFNEAGKDNCAEVKVFNEKSGLLSKFTKPFTRSSDLKKHKLDVFHSLEPTLLFNKPKNCKWVVTVHDLMFLRYPHLYGLKEISWIKQKVQFACKNADKIIAASKQTAQDIIEFYNIPAKKIALVYQGAHASFKEEYDSFILQRIASKYKLPSDFILSVGKLETRKNAMLTLKAMAYLRNEIDVPLVLVGKTTGYQDELQAYIKEKKLQDRVTILTDVAFEDLPKIYQLSSMFIYPSVFEGFSLPIIEALFSKVPVITSLGSSFSEAAGPNSIYVNPNDAEELAGAILRVLNNPTMATKMTIDGMAHALSFEDTSVANDLMKVYQEVVKE